MICTGMAAALRPHTLHLVVRLSLTGIGALALGFVCIAQAASQKPPPYGANREAAHTVQSEDAKIYYETFGSGGTPLVLLHGGLYGYIDEFAQLISEMSKRRKVIAIATR